MTDPTVPPNSQCYVGGAGYEQYSICQPWGQQHTEVESQTTSAPAGITCRYLHELAVFPNGGHDDQVNSMSSASVWRSGAASVPDLTFGRG